MQDRGVPVDISAREEAQVTPRSPIGWCRQSSGGRIHGVFNHTQALVAKLNYLEGDRHALFLEDDVPDRRSRDRHRVLGA